MAPVVQKLANAIHRINHYPAAKYLGNQLRYPEIYPLDNVIHLLNNGGLIYTNSFPRQSSFSFVDQSMLVTVTNFTKHVREHETKKTILYKKTRGGGTTPIAPSTSVVNTAAKRNAHEHKI